MKIIKSQNQQTEIQSWDSMIDDKLISEQMVSQITKVGEHITLNFTGRGATALIKGIKNIIEGGNSSELEGLLSRKQVMLRLGISYSTLCGWTREGVITPIKIGKKVFYRTKEVNAIESK